MAKRKAFELNKTKTKVSFILNDVFDTKTFIPEKVSIITDENLQMELKCILEDHMNKKRTQYYKYVL